MIVEGRSNLNMTNSVLPKSRLGKLTLKALLTGNSALGYDSKK
jgi:hypothetical protein